MKAKSSALNAASTPRGMANEPLEKPLEFLKIAPHPALLGIPTEAPSIFAFVQLAGGFLELTSTIVPNFFGLGTILSLTQ